MKVALIVTTYNWPEALNLCVRTIFAQTRLPDEIIIADDGSTQETSQLVQKLQQESPVPLIHSWQEDLGFRLAASRNRAIARATSDYIIIIDGDMILDPHFVEDHCRFATQGYYLQGSRVLLGQQTSQEILLTQSIPSGLVLKADTRNRLNALRIPWLTYLVTLFSSQNLGRIRGCNFSFWKKDALLVNGFNEAFTSWGREDSEFVARLYHHGLKRKNLKFGAIQYHLWHPQGSASKEADDILHQTLTSKALRCDRGIDQYLTNR